MKTMKFSAVFLFLFCWSIINTNAQNIGASFSIRWTSTSSSRGYVNEKKKTVTKKPVQKLPSSKPKAQSKPEPNIVDSIIKNNTIRLFKAIDNAYDNNSELSLGGISIMDNTRIKLDSLWNGEHFTCWNDKNEIQVQQTKIGWQVRNIPLLVEPLEVNEKARYEEAVVDFDKNGRIVDFTYCLNPEIYGKLAEQWVDGDNPVKDVSERQMVLHYVEQFRTAYNQRDIKFMENIFSDKALIVTGVVVDVKRGPTDVPKAERKVEDKILRYYQQSKKEYLDNLRKTFIAKAYINVEFSNLEISQLPNRSIYGALVKQKWSTAGKNGSGVYDDEGYVLIIWDFEKDPDNPQILVRTWQPLEYKDMKLEEKDIFKLGDFYD